ncbi:MAG: histidinol dehydrogenase [Firmicutes bacterium]|nr:histidinol dehydrogenase [Bacillota bacterium]
MLKIYNKNNVPELLSMLEKRAADIPSEIIKTVTDVLDKVKKEGDAALRELSYRFDGVEPDSLYLDRKMIEQSGDSLSPRLKKAMERAADNIRAFHESQPRGGVDLERGNIKMGQRVLPLKRIGLYVPGGRAAYPSSVLMNAIPAVVAGVEEIIMATPPKTEGINPAVLYAAKLAGVTDILTVGGAQAVSALAFGTESVKKVDKIVGPGNIFVATAKRLVYGAVDIDMIAGPSEVLVIADEYADPSYIAADLMAQAEHDPMAAAILVTTSSEVAENVCGEIARQIQTLPREEIIRKSLSSCGSAVVVDTLDEAAELSETIAPEHLELAVRDPEKLLSKVRNAGSVFLGEYTPEPLGDYYAGPNHVLPTNGTARFSSSLSTDSFLKRSTYLSYGKKELLSAADDVVAFAEAEGLYAHANSIKVRMG